MSQPHGSSNNNANNAAANSDFSHLRELLLVAFLAPLAALALAPDAALPRPDIVFCFCGVVASCSAPKLKKCALFVADSVTRENENREKRQAHRAQRRTHTQRNQMARKGEKKDTKKGEYAECPVCVVVVRRVRFAR